MKRLFAVMFLLLMCYASCNKASNVEKSNSGVTITSKNSDIYTTFDPTYAHIVYFWFKEGTTQNDRALFEKSLRTFLNKSKYAKTKFIGTPPLATRDVVDDSFTYNLVLTFDSAQAQQAYQDEVAHKVFIEECSHLWEKVIVYDANQIK